MCCSSLATFQISPRFISPSLIDLRTLQACPKDACSFERLQGVGPFHSFVISFFMVRPFILK